MNLPFQLCKVQHTEPLLLRVPAEFEALAKWWTHCTINYFILVVQCHLNNGHSHESQKSFAVVIMLLCHLQEYRDIFSTACTKTLFQSTIILKIESFSNKMSSKRRHIPSLSVYWIFQYLPYCQPEMTTKISRGMNIIFNTMKCNNKTREKLPTNYAYTSRASVKPAVASALFERL